MVPCRVLLNLVGNALKFTHEGEVKISLKEVGILPSAPPTSPDSHQYERRLVSITVRDTGIGMDDDFIRDRKYLVPFIQADPFSSGAGLGLSIVDSIVKRMGGKLDVASQSGLGTSITVTLPLDFLAGRSSPRSSPALPRIVRRNISEELARLLQPREDEPASATTAVPDVSKPEGGRKRSATLPGGVSVPAILAQGSTPIDKLDFDQAVTAMHASLDSPHASPALPATRMGRQPSLGRPDEPRRQVSGRSDDDQLAVEAAKLTLGTVGDKARSVVPMKDPLLLSPLPSPVGETPPSLGTTATKRQVKVLVAGACYLPSLRSQAWY